MRHHRRGADGRRARGDDPRARPHHHRPSSRPAHAGGSDAQDGRDVAVRTAERRRARRTDGGDSGLADGGHGCRMRGGEHVDRRHPGARRPRRERASRATRRCARTCECDARAPRRSRARAADGRARARQGDRRVHAFAVRPPAQRAVRGLPMTTVFWISLAVCIYVYFGYPALLWVLSRARPRPVREGDVTPAATLIIPACNEEKNIAAKIENTLALDYPPVEILVVSNGSTDATDDIVRRYAGRVTLIALEKAGKIEALNEGARRASGEILVFTDADFLLDPHALRTLARKFHDPEVGGVCGARSRGRRDGDSTGDGEGLYARWDLWQKVRESRIGSVFAADGLLYAIRRELYVPVTDPAQADDIAISARIPILGYRLLFEPKATAWENAAVGASGGLPREVGGTK